MEAALSPEVLASLEAEIERRARLRADALVRERIAAGELVVVVDPDEAELARRLGLQPTARAA